MSSIHCCLLHIRNFCGDITFQIRYFIHWTFIRKDRTTLIKPSKVTTQKKQLHVTTMYTFKVPIMSMVSPIISWNVFIEFMFIFDLLHVIYFNMTCHGVKTTRMKNGSRVVIGKAYHLRSEIRLIRNRLLIHLQNTLRHTALTIVSWPYLKQWLMLILLIDESMIKYTFSHLRYAATYIE